MSLLLMEEVNGLKSKIIVFIAMSLDGYIATMEDDLEWLMKVQGEGDNGYSEFMKDIDTVVMGRRTYEWLMKQDMSEWPYADLTTYVWTNSEMAEDSNVTFVNRSVSEMEAYMRQESQMNIWLVGGGGLIKSFLEHGAIDEWIITIAPVVLGGGIPLFQHGVQVQELTLVSERRYGEFLQLHYKHIND